MSRDLELEKQMHQDFTPWVADHAQTSGGKISDTGYNPDRFPPQQIDAAMHPALIEAAAITPGSALEKLRDQYAMIMGFSHQAARERINFFQDSLAFDDSDERLAETVADYIEDGKSVGLITDHAEGLFDMAIAQGGLSLAIANSRGAKHIASFNAWVNKLMVRQYYKASSYNPVTEKSVEKNIYIPDLLSVGGRTRWVIPDTDNGRRYIADEAISQTVNRGALASFAEDKRAGKGTVEVLVPAGTRMTTQRNEAGQPEHLIAPPIPESSANLLAHLDALVIFSNWSGRVSVSRLIEVKFPSRRERAEKTSQLAAQIREEMRIQSQKTSGLPIIFSEEIEAVS